MSVVDIVARERLGRALVDATCKECAGEGPCSLGCGTLNVVIGTLIQQRDALKATLKDLLENLKAYGFDAEFVRDNPDTTYSQLKAKAWELVKS